MNELPTIKKRRIDAKPQWSENDCDEYPQSPKRTQEHEGGFWSGGGGSCIEEHVQETSGYKLASTLKFEQRSGSSQCQLAWNVPNMQQRVASVTDIHLQMMSNPDVDEFESAAGYREEGELAWHNRSLSAKNSVVKGKERWVPLQNAKERLM